MVDIKTQQEIEIIAEGGKILSQILAELCKMAEEGGISTMDLEKKAEEMMKEIGAEPSFKNYHGYPNILCTSVNKRVVHGIPSKNEILQSGNIIGIDIGMKYKGLYTDMAYTVAVGEVSSEAQKLREVTKGALQAGLNQIKSGNHVGDIGFAVSKYVEDQNLGYGVVRQLTGHGVGRHVHEEPMIPNFGKPGIGEELKSGMVLAIEPMVTLGDWRVVTLDDGWTAVTADGSLAAHFEKTIVVTEDGYIILTPFLYEK
jgi:methionyl aminopeptidase